jgi:HEAT repeat protein
MARELQMGIIFFGISTVAGLIFMAVMAFIWPWFMSGVPGNPQKPARNEADLGVILEDLRSADSGARQRAAERLAKTKPDESRRAEVAEALAARLKDNHGGTHEAAARALVGWATTAQVPALLDVLDDDSGAVREAALEALGNLKDPRAVAPVTLRLLLPQDRKNAGKALQNLGSMAEKEVLKHLDDTDADLRVEVCRILKRIGTRESVAPLEALREKDKERRVRVAATEALATVTSRP